MSPRISIRLLSGQSDQRLLALARGGHERAFEALVLRYRRPLLRFCRRRMRLSHARAEDVVQQSLLKAWMALAAGTEVRDFKPWLYSIVRNTAFNAVRGQADGGGAARGDLPDGDRRAEPRGGGKHAGNHTRRGARPVVPRTHDATQGRGCDHAAAADRVGGRRCGDGGAGGGADRGGHLGRGRARRRRPAGEGCRSRAHGGSARDGRGRPARALRASQHAGGVGERSHLAGAREQRAFGVWLVACDHCRRSESARADWVRRWRRRDGARGDRSLARRSSGRSTLACQAVAAARERAAGRLERNDELAD
ncbi:MAG: RNA polymerase sigma factor [Chloroflexi bacterium]|nr:MAG: RNA polymerase sigma factor [Chloroflexota bacterium]